MKGDIDLIIISKSEVLDYDKYKNLPIERVELFRDLIQLKLIYFDGGFRSHLDLMNKAIFGKYIVDIPESDKEKMLTIWNMQSLNPYLAIAPLVYNDFKCKVITNFDTEINKLIEYSKCQKSKYIAISTTFILSFGEIGRIVKKIRSRIENAIIIVGGAFINDSFNTNEQDFIKSLKKYKINYALTSFNSEFDLLTLMKNLKYNEPLSKVNNLVYLKNDEYIINQKKWNEPNLGDIPILWDKFELDKNVTTVQIRTTSGCPFKCSFCTYPVAANGFHKDDPENVLRPQLERLKKLGHIKSIIFIDDTPNIPKSRFEKILDILKEYNFKWYSFLRVQYIDDNIAKKMKESGCDGVYLGIESADDNILKIMNKNATRNEYERGVELLNKYDIESLVAFIIGFPGETADSVKNNLEFIESNNINFYSLKEFFYMHTAPIHKRKMEFNLKGWGNSWSHNTMTSTEASKIKLEFFEKIKNSLYIDADTSLWYLAYLRDKGLSWEEIKQIQKILNEMMILDNMDKFVCDEKKVLFNNLKEILKYSRLNIDVI